MRYGEAIKAGFSNYLVFSGRALRSEYWHWTLFVVLGGIATAILDMLIFGSRFDAPLSPLNAALHPMLVRKARGRPRGKSGRSS